jgi:hypothetical protein
MPIREKWRAVVKDTRWNSNCVAPTLFEAIYNEQCDAPVRCFVVSSSVSLIAHKGPHGAGESCGWRSSSFLGLDRVRYLPFRCFDLEEFFKYYRAFVTRWGHGVDIDFLLVLITMICLVPFVFFSSLNHVWSLLYIINAKDKKKCIFILCVCERNLQCECCGYNQF